jgi:hypothetical protein
MNLKIKTIALFLYVTIFLTNLIPLLYYHFVPKGNDIKGWIATLFIIELSAIILWFFFTVVFIILKFFGNEKVEINRKIYCLINFPILIFLGYGHLSPLSFLIYRYFANDLISFVLSISAHSLVVLLISNVFFGLNDKRKNGR